MKHSPWFELECIVTTCLYLASKVEDTARRVSDVCNVVRDVGCGCKKKREKKVKEEEKKGGSERIERERSHRCRETITRGRM